MRRARTSALAAALPMLCLSLVLLGCRQSEQTSAVEDLNAKSELIRIACLDLNGDGRVNAADADPAHLPDVTGDGRTDGADVALLNAVDFTLPNGKPDHCSDQPDPDWEVSPFPATDCNAGDSGLILFGVGGGAVELSNVTNAAGVRWMLQEIGKVLDDRGMPHQFVSVAPSLGGLEQSYSAAEALSAAYLTQTLGRYPCLRAILIGHSHGGVTVTATASRLEEAGLSGQVPLAVLIDRVTAIYGGDTTSIPQTIPVFNVYLDLGSALEGVPIDQANVENWNATGQLAPKNGEQGGSLEPANHSTVDNSEGVLFRIIGRLLAAL